MNSPITPLQHWIAGKIGIAERSYFDAASLQTYQLAKLKETIDFTCKNSPFFRQHLAHINPANLNTIADITNLPFTYPADIAQSGLQMVCVSQSEIARIVTLHTPGTSADPKRIFFTLDDLELTADFFAHGMKALVTPGQKVMVLMPGNNIGSVGERLSQGLSRIDCQTVVHGLVANPEQVINKINSLEIDCLIGLPVQVQSLARWPEKVAPGRIKSVLLSGDYLPQPIIDSITQAWDCPVFNHYGLTETGLGGGVECSARQGCHLREADIFLEIVDTQGRSVADGAWGEIVLTTLTRTGMPLIRYRTGDISRFLASRCVCGSNLKRLDRVMGRSVHKFNANELRLDEIDEALFTLTELIDFDIHLQHNSTRINLNIEFWTIPNASPYLATLIREKFLAIPRIKQLTQQKVLHLDSIYQSSKKLFSNPTKRRMKREQDA